MPLIDPVTMSSSAGKMTKDTETFNQPIPILRTPLAQGARHVHPVLLLSFFLVRFESLVADPVSTIWSSLPVVVAIQVAYAIVCLPAAGSATAKPPKKLRPGEKKKQGPDGTAPNAAVTAVVSLLLSLLLAPVLHVFFVLFGAPFLTHLSHTGLCSIYLSVLGLFPLFYTRGLSKNDWLEILGARAPFDEAFGGLMGGCVGAWLGAVPIPLDWDREWQKWPVTILCGIYGGYVVGKLIGGTIAFGRKFG